MPCDLKHVLCASSQTFRVIFFPFVSHSISGTTNISFSQHSFLFIPEQARYCILAIFEKYCLSFCDLRRKTNNFDVKERGINLISSVCLLQSLHVLAQESTELVHPLLTAYFSTFVFVTKLKTIKKKHKDKALAGAGTILHMKKSRC